MENMPARDGRLDPMRLPTVRGEELPTLTGDRLAGATFCAGCGQALETGVVIRGFWTYCSIECAMRTEQGDRRAS